MHVYLLRPDSERYQSLVLERDEDWQHMLDWFSGEPMHPVWRPVTVEAGREGPDDPSLPPSDYPALSGVVPVFSQRAVEALGDVLQPNGEILPLICSEGTYFAYNVTRLVDALDIQRSECQYVNKRLLIDVPRYEFVGNLLEGLLLFKLPQFRKTGRLYVTDQFVQRVEDAHLTGFLFKEIWSGTRSTG